MDAHKQISLLEDQLSRGEARRVDSGELADAVVVPLVNAYLESLKVEQALDLFNRYSRHFDEDQEYGLTLKTGQVLTFGEAWDLSLKCFGRCAEICRKAGADERLAEVCGYMATAHRKMGELDRALELHQQQEELGLSAGSLQQQAAGCAGQGILMDEKEEWEAAAELLSEAAVMYRALEDRAAQAIVQARLARADYMNSHDRDAALELVHKAHKLCREPPIQARVGESCIQLALQLDDDGEGEAAMSVLRLVLEAAKKAEDFSTIANTLVSMADVALGLERPDQALEHLSRAREVWAGTGERAGEADVWGRLGMLHYRTGDPNEAIQSFGHAMQILDGLGDRESLGSVYHSIGKIYLEHGAPDNAVTYLEKSLELLARGNEQQLPHVQFDLSAGYIETGSRPDRARQLLELAAQGFAELGDEERAERATARAAQL